MTNNPFINVVIGLVLSIMWAVIILPWLTGDRKKLKELQRKIDEYYD